MAGNAAPAQCFGNLLNEIPNLVNCASSRTFFSWWIVMHWWWMPKLTMVLYYTAFAEWYINFSGKGVLCFTLTFIRTSYDTMESLCASKRTGKVVGTDRTYRPYRPIIVANWLIGCNHIAKYNIFPDFFVGVHCDKCNKLALIYRKSTIWSQRARFCPKIDK